jgi:CubicO group peptidase (beta-lactamase class C family)
MRIRHVAMLAAVVGQLAAYSRGTQVVSTGEHDRINQAMARLVGRGFSGSVLVARHDSVILHEGYGWLDKAHTVRVLPDTKFYVASISKQFAAAAILRLQEQGRLKVGDPINKYLTGVPEDKAAITIHSLLTHTSGLDQAYAADGMTNRDEAVRRILAAPLKGKPGEFTYTNDGYSLIAAVVEVAAQQPFETYLREQILRRAGLASTGFWADPIPSGEPQIAPTLKVIHPVANWGFRGATGMYSTTADLDRWRRALDSSAVLTPESVKEMFTPYAPTPFGGYGYGWFSSKTAQRVDSRWTSGAEDFGHNAFLGTYADGTAIAVTSNAGNLDGGPARETATSAIEAVIFGKTVTSVAGPKRPQSVDRRLDTVDDLVPHHVFLDAVTYRGRQAVHVVNQTGGGDAIVVVPATTMTDGSIEADVAGRPESGASEGARGFIGLAFRVVDEWHYDCVYIRPTNGRADDQVRRNHATQYVSLPDFDALRLRAEAPGLYESYVDLVPGEWTHLRVDVAGKSVKFYVNAATQPALVVNEVKRAAAPGLVGLWIGDETDGYFSQLKVTRRATQGLSESLVPTNGAFRFGLDPAGGGNGLGDKTTVMSLHR